MDSNLKLLGLKHILALKCPRCGTSELVKKWPNPQFNLGCAKCEYLYEREPGYFTGASWMVCFPLTALAGLALGAFFLICLPEVELELVLVIASVVSLLLGLISMPYCMAAWL